MGGSAKRLFWPAHSVYTYRPRACMKVGLPISTDISTTADEMQDLAATKFMASAPSAKDVGMLKVIQYSHDVSTESQVREALSHSVAVLLVGWNPELTPNFNVSDIERYRPPIQQRVSWQGEPRIRITNVRLYLIHQCTLVDARARAGIFNKDINDRVYNDTIQVGDLRSFVKAGEKGFGKAWNCLDLPRINQEVPAFVRYVAHHSRTHVPYSINDPSGI